MVSVVSFPPNFRNVSSNECDMNDEMQRVHDETTDPQEHDSSLTKETHFPHPSKDQQEAMDYSNEQFGVLQRADNDVDALYDFITHWKVYMANVVMLDPSYSSVRDKCRNKHELCSYWAMLGECSANPGYMKVNCAPACQSCEQLEFNNRCPFDADNADNTFESGDVSRFFERIVDDEEFAKYNISIHSRPKQPGDDESIKDGPWLITFDDFINAEEAERLIELGSEEEYKRSTDVGEANIDGSYEELVHSTRTSSNAWCLATCMADPVAQNVVNRIEHVTQIPQSNSESLQLLRYEPGQYYRRHHDLIEHQIDRAPGVRILTFYMYLNGNEDSGLEGGGTEFPRLGITVTPKRGRAALWTSVLNDNPHHKDPRMDHAALPVTKGVKFGANAWIHQRDYMTPNSKGCA